MKKIYKIALSLLIVTGALTSCSNEEFSNSDGEGQVNLIASLDNDVKVITRATGEDLAALTQDFRLYIYSSKGLIRKYHSQDELPTEGLMLVSGTYEADLWAGDSTAASYTHKYFKGKESFTITAGSVETVNVVGKIQNTVASVTFDEDLKSDLTDAVMTIGTSAGTLDFTYDNASTAKGYYMLPNGETSLTWTLTGTMSNGSQYSKTGTVANVQGATEYQFNIEYNPSTQGEVGGGSITVTVDETTIDVTETVTLTAAPKITASGFDISQPFYSSKGNFESKISIYVSAAAKLSNIVVSCDNTTAWETALGIAGASSFDLITANTEVKTKLKEAGVYLPASTDSEGNGCGYDEENDQQIEKIIFTKDLLNKLEDGSYNFTITATDVTGKNRMATLDIEVSDAKVVTLASTVRQVSATLSASIADTEATGFGFEYRLSGESTWAKSTDVTINSTGTEYTLTLTGLTAGATYEYRAICTGYTSTVTNTFTTNANFQMPNSGFETWDTSETPYLIGDRSFWDSGNHGSSTLGVNLTTPDGTYKHGGNYSAKLKSQFVSLFGIGKFAAGNLFTGRYITTVGTSGGIIGFGRPYTQDDGPRPTKLKGYVRYECGTVDYESEGHISKGDPDIGVIYIAMLDDTQETYKSYGTYPIMIDNTSDKLFNKTAANVMGYGEIEYNASTSGDGMIEFEITIDYTQEGMPSNILVVASASKYGDYFAGSTGSTMWLDDLELVYE